MHDTSWLHPIQFTNVRGRYGDSELLDETQLAAIKAEYALWAEMPAIRLKVGSAMWQTTVEIGGKTLFVTRLLVDLSAKDDHPRIQIETENFIIEGDLLAPLDSAPDTLIGELVGCVGVDTIRQLILEPYTPVTPQIPIEWPVKTDADA